ncbi:hypothetical protein NW754_012036 [Fusarium falciforme]|nr:hypothetical protein NW754_012036 [Fusarium falciforme]
MPLTPIKPSERIDSWRQRVPSRLERRDPFEGDGFEERPSTRLTFREASPPCAPSINPPQLLPRRHTSLWTPFHLRV